MPTTLMNVNSRIKIISTALDNPEQQQVVEQELRTAKGDLTAVSPMLNDKLPHYLLQRLLADDLVARVDKG